MRRQLILSILIGIVIALPCSVKLDTLNIYPTDTEYFDLNLDRFFDGNNLTFTATGLPGTMTVSNYIDPLDVGTSLPNGFQFEAAAIRQHQTTGLWDESIALLGLVDNLPTVFFSELSYSGTPSFSGVGKILLQQEVPMIALPGLTWIDSEYVLIDTYQEPKGSGALVNSWQRVDALTDQLPVIFPSSNNQNTNDIDGRITKFYRGPAFNYVLRGTLSTKPNNSFIEVFRIVDQIPEAQPCGTIDSTFLQNINMVDFAVSNVGEIWILNWSSTLVRVQMKFSSNGDVQFRTIQTVQLADSTNFVALDLEIDYKSPMNTSFTLLLASTSRNGNILQYQVIPNMDPVYTASYTAPVVFKFTGVPPNLESNLKFITVEYLDYSNIENSQVYLFQKTNSTININDFTYSQKSFWHSLNEQPSMMLSLTDQVQLSYVETPQLYGQFLTQQSGVIVVSATSITTCKATIPFTYLNERDYSIQISNPNITYPNYSYVTQNTTLDFSNYLNGPSILVSGSVSVVGNDDKIQALPSNNSIIQTTYLPINLKAPSHYPKSGTFIKNAINPNDGTLIQFIQSNYTLQAFICETIDEHNKNCSFIGITETGNYIIPKLELFFPVERVPYAYGFALSDEIAENQLVFWEVDWDSENKTGHLFFLQTLTIEVEGIPIKITDFTVVDQQLYLTLNEINQIWEYEIGYVNGQSTLTKSLVISNDKLNLKEGFSPLSCLGNTKTLGPVLVINNQQEFVIVSTLNNNLMYISTTQFSLTTPGIQSAIALSGEYLIVCQSSSTQSSIAAYSLFDLSKPILEKTLPLYGQKLFTPFQITSDEYFFYALLDNDSVNVYKPSGSSHDTLFHQFKNMNPAVQFHFSATYDGQYAYLSCVDPVAVQNKRLQKHIEAILQPGSANSTYFSTVQYNLQATNVFGAPNISSFHQTIIFNPQININFDQAKYNSQNNFIYGTTQNVFFSVPNFLSGNIATYQITCDQCPSKVNLINAVTSYKTDLKFQEVTITQVESMVNSPDYWFSLKNQNPKSKSGTIVQSLKTIYLVNDQLDVYFIQETPQSDKTIFNCKGLAARSDFIVSSCEIDQIGILFQVVYSDQRIQNHAVQSLANLVKIDLIGSNILILGDDNNALAIRALTIYNFEGTTINKVKTFRCGKNEDEAVVDFQFTKGYPFIMNNQQSTRYTLFYTCYGLQETPYYVDVILNEQTQKLTLSERIPLLDTSKIQTLPDTYFSSVRPLKIDTTQPSQVKIYALITTNNIQSIVYRFTFDYSQLPTKSLEYLPTVYLTSIPPYGSFTHVNPITYLNGFLVIPYSNYEQRLQFIAVYNLNVFNYDMENQPNLNMLGGFYAPLASTFNYQLQQYLPNQPLYILTSSSNGNQNLSTILVEKAPYWQFNTSNAFNNQKVYIKASNYFDSVEYTTEVSYGVSQEEKQALPIWAWLLIVLGVIMIISAVVLLVLRYKKQQTYPTVNNEPVSNGQSLVINSGEDKLLQN